jgi:hypothetical protein
MKNLLIITFIYDIILTEKNVLREKYIANLKNIVLKKKKDDLSLSEGFEWKRK